MATNTSDRTEQASGSNSGLSKKHLSDPPSRFNRNAVKMRSTNYYSAVRNTGRDTFIFKSDFTAVLKIKTWLGNMQNENECVWMNGSHMVLSA